MHMKAQPCLEMPSGKGTVVHMAIVQWVITNHTVIIEGKKMAFPLQGSSVEFWNSCSLVSLERKMTVKENSHVYVCLSVFLGKQGSPVFSSVAHFQVI